MQCLLGHRTNKSGCVTSSDALWYELHGRLLCTTSWPQRSISGPELECPMVPQIHQTLLTSLLYMEVQWITYVLLDSWHSVPGAPTLLCLFPSASNIPILPHHPPLTPVIVSALQYCPTYVFYMASVLPTISTVSPNDFIPHLWI